MTVLNSYLADRGSMNQSARSVDSGPAQTIIYILELLDRLKSFFFFFFFPDFSTELCIYWQINNDND